jgi:hypothetical protein
VPDGDHQLPSSSVAAAESMSSYRPPPLQTSYSSPEPRGLRQSASFTALHARTDTALPPIQDLASYSKRNSDETPGAKPKKKTISSFVNSMLGSPRNIKISAPENPVHVTHVGYDNQTGQFTVSSKSHRFTPPHPPRAFDLARCYNIIFFSSILKTQVPKQASRKFPARFSLPLLIFCFS